MRQTNHFLHRANCLWTAHRLEHHLNKLARSQKETAGPETQHMEGLLRLERKIGGEMALIRYLTEKYQILTKGASHPERLAI